jgi:hypothetical protein
MIELAFLHIPKTAGSAVTEPLLALAQERAVLPWRLDRSLFGRFSDWEGIPRVNRDLILLPDELARAAAQRFEVATGHFSMGDRFMRSI